MNTKLQVPRTLIELLEVVLVLGISVKRSMAFLTRFCDNFKDLVFVQSFT